MSKVITFSRNFPSYHLKEGKPTYFVEKLLKSLYIITPLMEEYFANLNPDYPEISDFRGSLLHPMNFHPKYHTIRAGRRFKKGDYFSPRIWSAKPYNSKQIILASDIEIKNTWDIEIEMPIRKFQLTNDEGTWWQYDKGNTIQQIATNDGLEIEELWNWFPKTFEGQIICWNENIQY